MHLTKGLIPKGQGQGYAAAAAASSPKM
ncbi:hypothetical protein CCACVL1_09732, partial [Corchorus capsularis]